MLKICVDGVVVHELDVPISRVSVQAERGELGAVRFNGHGFLNLVTTVKDLGAANLSERDGRSQVFAQNVDRRVEALEAQAEEAGLEDRRKVQEAAAKKMGQDYASLSAEAAKAKEAASPYSNDTKTAPKSVASTATKK